ncbi:adenosylcobinamide-GDP ribazoletransferase [Hoeflea poritis]|uniref:Adenosylcobinamide-GDP ribazoletransferase n=1 Tax=Hoeflea poritis TaxID=2993659 RepID=A0ABT4VI33_9HYPH|nr:adenosylcobinamide-GDP ribazoletransferase [Hoeflea poritis]MDA4844355.1 adenosylcobinamide-GDP ribazoletransferase [Hoeflea poritis]
MEKIVAETARAVSFLSRLPAPDRFFPEDAVPAAQSARTYPLAGVIVALPAAALLFLLLSIGLDALFASALAVAVQVLTTGALHEDGLADCADGFGGGRDRDRVLAIMKDSSIGAYGCLAVVFSLLLRVAGVAAIASATHALPAALALIAVAVVSRTAMVWHWHVLPAAKPDGVAASAGQPDSEAAGFAMVAGALLGGLLSLPAAGIGGAITALLLAAILCSGFVRMTSRRIHGHTGDTIGATQQICEIVSLLGLALWV